MVEAPSGPNPYPQDAVLDSHAASGENRGQAARKLPHPTSSNDPEDVCRFAEGIQANEVVLAPCELLACD